MQRIIIINTLALFIITIAAFIDNIYSLSCNITTSNSNYLDQSEVLNKYKLWPNIISNDNSGETLVGLEYAMDVIWKNQHPEDCSKAKYYMSSGANSGFGAEIHIESGHLARAIDMGRVYIINPDKINNGIKIPNDYNFVNNDFCKSSNKTNLECYYEPLTHCTWEDALGGKLLAQITHHTPNPRVKEGLLESEERSLYVHALNSPHAPEKLKDFYECSRVPHLTYESWWFAMSTAYYMRPNQKLLNRFTEHRNDPTLLFDSNQERCVSVKIRRGDKHTEMELIKDETEFFQAAGVSFERLKSQGDRIALKQQQPVMFVESEDPDVMDSAKKWCKDNNWKMLYADIYDKRTESSGWMNKTEMVAAKKANTFIRSPDEYFLILLTIDYHLRCSGFVCTTASNACRIIDELRKTAAGKNNSPYFDMRHCKNGRTPPCYV